ncbi:MAG: hypothetical protein AYK19_14180 [Theionarchaea archaeon DG-70-1]|nr:MAG: hypothetical protein AYK19_14180 [Theionarchaea archaeon DG-70-1]
MTEFILESAPHAPLGMVSREIAPDSYLLLDPDTPNWIILNSMGREIISMCDGKSTLKEIIKTLCEKYGESYKESVENVLAFANEMKEKGFIQESKFPPPQRVNKENTLYESIWVNVTNACNLRCIHCHLSSGTPLENELTTEEICNIISEVKELGVKEIVISGGEPFCRKDILEILEYVRNRCERVTLLTNGTLITEEIAEKLSNLKLAIQVSLDGASKDTQDFIRGKDSYEKTLKGLQNLVAHNANVRVAMTIMKRNMDEIQEMADLVKNLGVKYLHFPTLQVKGRAKEYEPVVRLEDEDMVAAVMEMHRLSQAGDIIITVERNIQEELDTLGQKDLCGAGSSLVSVAADGNVYPCAGLHEGEFCAGNIREKSLKEIWKESEVFKKLRQLSVLDIEKCSSCELKFICGGGCQVDKYHAHGRLDIPTPLCYAQQKIYWYYLCEKKEEIL